MVFQVARCLVPKSGRKIGCMLGQYPPAEVGQAHQVAQRFVLGVGDAGCVEHVPHELPPRPGLVHQQIGDDAAADCDYCEACE